MRRKGILALALAAAATLVVGVAVAFAAKSYSTHIVYLGNAGSITDHTFYGDLNSNPKCRGARLVGLFKETSNGSRLIDVDLSSFNGAWALRGDVTGLPDLLIHVKREKRSKGRVVCKAASYAITASPPAATDYRRAG